MPNILPLMTHYDNSAQLFASYGAGGGGGGVSTVTMLNGLSNAVGLVAGTNIKLTTNTGSNSITINADISGGTVGEGYFTNLFVSGTTKMSGSLQVGASGIGGAYSQRQILPALSNRTIPFTGVNLEAGQYLVTVKDSANGSNYYSANVGLTGVPSNPDQAAAFVTLISNTSNWSGASLTFASNAIPDEDLYSWTPTFGASNVNPGSSYTFVASPNFGF